jgi:DinB family protein
MTAEERKTVLDQLASSRDRLREAVAGLTPEQWRFKPAPDTYSVAECIEHLSIGESGVVARLIEKIRTGPPAPDPETARKDSLVWKAVPRRKHKVKAPPEMAVKTAAPTLAVGLGAFEAVRAATIAFTETTDADLRAYSWPHFTMGPLDGWQWILLTALHAERHTLQIEEIKAHPEFP